jgi:hypothetical protein
MTDLATEEEPMPDGDGRKIHDLVQEDLESRAKLGKEKYGERLRAFNGRDALKDSYQEVLDLAVYLRQLIEERGTTGDSSGLGAEQKSQTSV